MSVIYPGLFSVMRRFPAEKDTLRRIYLNNRTFQVICVDYQRCVDAHDYWSHSEDDRASERCCEYKELQKNLEQEVEDFLSCAHRVDTDSKGQHE